MYLGFLVHMKLLLYIFQLLWYKYMHLSFKCMKTILKSFFRFTSGVWFINRGVNMAKQIKASKYVRKQAVVILTKISTHDYPPPAMTEIIGKQNSFFLERIMTEKLAFILTNLKRSYEEQGKELSLFVCYQDRYFFKSEISDWLEHLPDYSKAFVPKKDSEEDINKRFETIKESFQNNLDRVDLSFDADSFCSPKLKPCKKAKNSIFKYVCVEDTEDGRALEAAIRVGFYHDNQDIVVLNPHAVAITQQHIVDALSYLENMNHSKERLIYGKTHSDSLYLLGVSRSRETLLNIRSLTQDVIWGSGSAHQMIQQHQGHLNWTGACLRSVLEDVNGLESLRLVEQELGLRMEHVLDDKISVVIPTLNHEEYVQETLESLIYHVSGKRFIQIIAVDGNSTDYTLKKLEKFQASLHSYIESAHDIFPYRGHSVHLKNSVLPRRSRKDHSGSVSGAELKKMVTFQIIQVPTGFTGSRDDQVRYAVETAVEGGTLLVIRPGTNLPLYWDISIRKCLNQLGVILGTFSFHLHLQDRYIARKHIGWALRCVAMNFLFNWRSKKLEMPSGDQGFFIYTYYYHKLLQQKRHSQSTTSSSSSATTRYPPGLDDVALLDRVKLVGHIYTSPATVTVCPIKSLRFGFCRSWLLDALMLCAYRLGADPETLGQYHKQMIVLQPDYFDGY